MTIVILVRPQMGENIGAAARIMKNFGIFDLRIVAPRDSWPNKKAEAMAVGAIDILKNAKIFETLEEAASDIQYLVATTARMREMEKPVLDSAVINKKIMENANKGRKCAVMFGPERTGLTNQEVVLADAIVTIPVNEEYSSVNLAQSVAIICYELSRDKKKASSKPERSPMAAKNDIISLFNNLEQQLDKKEFFRPREKRQKMVDNLRNIFLKASLTEQEVRTLRGVITSLAREDKK